MRPGRFWLAGGGAPGGGKNSHSRATRWHPAPSSPRSTADGTDYIDEVVQQHNFTNTGAQSTYHVLQDANWDVIALANLSGTLAEQYALDPYGQRFAAERVNTNGTLTTLDPLTGAATLLTRNGLFLNPYTGNLENRARTLNARLLRMNQRDPNETALNLYKVLLSNAHTASGMASLSARGQYMDGMNLYQYVRSNPITRTDPSGLNSESDFDYFDEGERVMASIVGTRGANLEELSEALHRAYDASLMMASLGVSFAPGGTALLLAVEIASGNFTMSDLTSIAIGTGAGYAAKYAGRALLRVWRNYRESRRLLQEGAETAIRTMSAPSSRALGANLRSAGVVQQRGTAAHHIVAGADHRAARARETLARFGIDINDVDNGVFLPHDRLSPAPGSYHRVIHTERYFNEVNRRLRSVSTRDELIGVLGDIADELLANTFPL